MAAERMSRVDTSWLRMDNDVNLMMIVGVWLLEPGITLAQLRERVADKLLKYERFRRKVVQDAVGASWVDDEAFDPMVFWTDLLTRGPERELPLFFATGPATSFFPAPADRLPPAPISTGNFPDEPAVPGPVAVATRHLRKHS